MTFYTGNIYNTIAFHLEETTWKVDEILHSQIMAQVLPYEEKTILRCTQLSPTMGKTAIIKAHLQIPDNSGDALDGAVNAACKTEIDALRQLTKRGCSSVPQLISYCQMTQPEGFPLPGGYLVCILMEMVSGKSIMDFWEYDRETRDRIREAFRKSWRDVNNAGVYHIDSGLRNLLWDEKTGKCYMMDFECASTDQKRSSFCDAEYVFWELVRIKDDEYVW
ncbi:hypothetical protein FQN54_000308 [Arachnomyces sp. PD_36]|nr:hypothetical protein FQN54_000308 [Arachnomyces sp. PD_36]